MSRRDLVSGEALTDWLLVHPRWTLSSAHLVLSVSVDYNRGVAFAVATTAWAEELDHHPYVTIGYDTLRVELWTHDRGGVSSLDLEFAERVERFLDREG